MLRGIIRGLVPTTKNDMNVLISPRLYNSSQALLCHAHEGMRVACRLHSIHSDGHASIGTIFEADGEGDTGGQLAMKLRLGGSCTDGTPGDEICEVLWGYSVEEFRADGDAEGSEITEKLAGHAEAFVDFERAVDVGVVDETFPTNGCARFLG